MMNDLLNELITRSGVRAVFVCDQDGHMLASALSDAQFTQALEPLSSIINRANSALMTLKHGGLKEVEWVYSGGRVLVRELESALLCLICDRSINLQLLTMKLEEIQGQVQEELGRIKREPSSEDIARLKQRMIAIAEEMLGEHAGKVVAIVKVTGDTMEALEQACEQAEKVTRLFIDRKKAGDLDARMRELLEAYR
jgi:predicted regulator of Ras-like GTPase activity (Roadblock/LC7/MglB family)